MGARYVSRTIGSPAAAFGRLVRLGLASAGAAARWMAAIERLAASGQFAFTLNYYAARGIKP